MIARTVKVGRPLGHNLGWLGPTRS